MKSDEAIKRNVEAELSWNPEIDATDIAVQVNKGVVALAGFVSSYADKHRAEATAKRLPGVTAIANDITVRLALGDVLPDPDIARESVGTVKWHHQRERAESAVRRLRGAVSVRNSIRIEPRLVCPRRHQCQKRTDRQNLSLT
jgi:osmotically-inducible protein OsmY